MQQGEDFEMGVQRVLGINCPVMFSIEELMGLSGIPGRSHNVICNFYLSQ